MNKTSSLQFVQMKYVDMHLERPPNIRLFFDVMLVNEYSEPRWFLLPDWLEAMPTPEKFAIDIVEVYQLSGQGRVAVGHFSGSSGFQALLLPAGAQVKLRRFPILFRGQIPVSIPTSVRMEVVIASQLTVGGKPAGGWFGMNPMSDVRAEVKADALKDQSEVLVANSTPDDKEVPATMVEGVRVELQVSITLDDN